MRKIVKQNKELTVDISTITDQSFVGVECNKEKFLIVSRRMNDNTSVFTRMNDAFFVLGDSCYTSIKNLLVCVTYQDAFLFDNRLEAITWLMK